MFFHDVLLTRRALVWDICLFLPRPWLMPYAKSEKSFGDMLVISSIVLGMLFITPSCCILALSVSFSIAINSLGWP